MMLDYLHGTIDVVYIESPTTSQLEHYSLLTWSLCDDILCLHQKLKF